MRPTGPSAKPAAVGRNAANSALAASLAFALSTTAPVLTPAYEPPAVVRRAAPRAARRNVLTCQRRSSDAASATHRAQVQQAGANMVADTDLSDRQAKFLQERNKMQQKYEAQSEVQGNYLTAAETEEKKGKSIGVVGGLIIIAFVAPMVQFFYYTGGE